jgi:hypothetical protein
MTKCRSRYDLQFLLHIICYVMNRNEIQRKLFLNMQNDIWSVIAVTIIDLYL